jgi:hypothetical protein
VGRNERRWTRRRVRGGGALVDGEGATDQLDYTKIVFIWGSDRSLEMWSLSVQSDIIYFIQSQEQTVITTKTLKWLLRYFMILWLLRPQ